MSKVAAITSLVRWKNLLMLAITLLLVRYFILDPVFFNYKTFLQHSLSGIEYLVFVIATCCIAAAGYIVNDYFDETIDRQNRPGKVILGNALGRQEAFRLHLILNGVGGFLGILVAWLAGNIKLGLIFFVSAGLLWFYAKSFKRQFFVGNLIVAFLSGLAVFLPYLFEDELLITEEINIIANMEVLPVVAAYAVFAFLITLIREIVKDCEDREGDEAANAKTIPIALGINGAKVFSILLIIVLIAALAYVQVYFYGSDRLTLVAYIFIALQLPLVGVIFNLIPSNSSDEFQRLSNWLKSVTALGILSMPVYHWF